MKNSTPYRGINPLRDLALNLQPKNAKQRKSFNWLRDRLVNCKKK